MSEDQFPWNLKFMNPVQTKDGPALFIGFFGDGLECQVAMWVERDGKSVQVNATIPTSRLQPVKAHSLQEAL